MALSPEAIPIPECFTCCITHEIMIDPVCTCDGQSYERGAIMEWFRQPHNRASPLSPLTGLPLLSQAVVSNHALKSAIEAFKAIRPEVSASKDVDFKLAVQIYEEELNSKAAISRYAQERLEAETKELWRVINTHGLANEVNRDKYQNMQALVVVENPQPSSSSREPPARPADTSSADSHANPFSCLSPCTRAYNESYFQRQEANRRQARASGWGAVRNPWDEPVGGNGATSPRVNPWRPERTNVDPGWGDVPEARRGWGTGRPAAPPGWGAASRPSPEPDSPDSWRPERTDAELREIAQRGGEARHGWGTGRIESPPPAPPPGWGVPPPEPDSPERPFCPPGWGDSRRADRGHREVRHTADRSWREVRFGQPAPPDSSYSNRADPSSHDFSCESSERYSRRRSSSSPRRPTRYWGDPPRRTSQPRWGDVSPDRGRNTGSPPRYGWGRY